MITVFCRTVLPEVREVLTEHPDTGVASFMSAGDVLLFDLDDARTKEMMSFHQLAIRRRPVVFLFREMTPEVPQMVELYPNAGLYNLSCNAPDLHTLPDVCVRKAIRVQLQRLGSEHSGDNYDEYLAALQRDCTVTNISADVLVAIAGKPNRVWDSASFPIDIPVVIIGKRQYHYHLSNAFPQFPLDWQEEVQPSYLAWYLQAYLNR